MIFAGSGCWSASCFEHVGVGAGAGLRLLDDRQLELVEQHLGELLGRGDVERVAGQLFDLDFQLFEPLAVARAQLGEPRGIDADAVELHVGEHVDQRHFDRCR